MSTNEWNKKIPETDGEIQEAVVWLKARGMLPDRTVSEDLIRAATRRIEQQNAEFTAVVVILVGIMSLPILVVFGIVAALVLGSFLH